MVVSTNLLPNGKQQYFDGNGNPLASGKVYFYVPNTTTFKNTWQDPERVSLNTNPVQLDLNGEAVIFGDGIYRQVLKDVNGVEIWDELSIQFITVGGDLSGQLPNPTVNPALFIAQFNTNKNPPVDNDRFLALDSGASLAPIYFLWSQIKAAMTAALEAIFDLRYAQATNVGLGFSGLKVNVISNTQVTISVNKLVAFTAANAAIVGNALNITADISTSGANGLDTGAEAANTWYNVWAIYNPTTQIWAALLSLSATAPTMPSGYTYKVRVGVIRNDNSSNLYRTLQNDKRATYVIGANPTVGIIGASGSAGNPSTPTFVNKDLSAFVPPTATVLIGNALIGGTSGGTSVIVLAPNGSYGSFASVTNAPPVSVIDGETAAGQSQAFEMTLETAQHAWYAAQTSDCVVFVIGWYDQL